MKELKLTIVLASQSGIKIEAVAAACVEIGVYARLYAIKAPSQVAEQPVNNEGLQGARNRITLARQAERDGDVYIAIESFIYEVSGRFLERAVVICSMRDGDEEVRYTDPIEIPRACVEEAMQRGFDKVTTGEVMREQGLVRDAKDPHFELTGGKKSRAQFLTESLSVALYSLLKLDDTMKRKT